MAALLANGNKRKWQQKEVVEIRERKVVGGGSTWYLSLDLQIVSKFPTKI